MMKKDISLHMLVLLEQENNIDRTLCTQNMEIDNLNVQDAVNSDHF